MTKLQPAKLGSTIVVKGQAKPTNLTETPLPVALPATDPSMIESVTHSVAAQNFPNAIENTEPSPTLATKSMTVKVDVATYKRLKSHGIAIDKTSQDIFVAALALYFKANKI
jgi:hypothetical protein